MTRKEYSNTSWLGLLSNHGFDDNNHSTYDTFAGDLIRKCNYTARNETEAYEFYVEWWNAHFGTKLHKHLAGVENAD